MIASIHLQVIQHVGTPHALGPAPCVVARVLVGFVAMIPKAPRQAWLARGLLAPVARVQACRDSLPEVMFRKPPRGARTQDCSAWSCSQRL